MAKTRYTKEMLINAIFSLCDVRIKQNNSVLAIRQKTIDPHSLHSQNSLAREIMNLIGTIKLKK